MTTFTLLTGNSTARCRTIKWRGFKCSSTSFSLCSHCQRQLSRLTPQRSFAGYAQCTTLSLISTCFNFKLHHCCTLYAYSIRRERSVAYTIGCTVVYGKLLVLYMAVSAAYVSERQEHIATLLWSSKSLNVMNVPGFVVGSSARLKTTTQFDRDL